MCAIIFFLHVGFNLRFLKLLCLNFYFVKHDHSTLISFLHILSMYTLTLERSPTHIIITRHPYTYIYTHTSFIPVTQMFDNLAKTINFPIRLILMYFPILMTVGVVFLDFIKLLCDITTMWHIYLIK